jgi:hypothetical protein
LPEFTGGSSEKFRIAPDQVQIDTTHSRPQAPAKSALSRTNLALNRTAVAFALFVGDGNSLFRWGDYLQLKHPRSAGPMQNVDAFTRLIQIPGASP